MKIICIGRNYAEHAAELHEQLNDSGKLPEEPMFFLKPDTALLRNNDPFYIPSFSQEVHYECELVVRINRVGKAIAERFAHRYYDAVTVGIDFTAREMQKKLREAGQPWELAKGFDGSAVIGEWVDIQKFRDIQALHFRLDLNDKTVQEGCTSDMLYKVDEIISYISQYFTLKTGDLLYTGCPTGCGPVNIDDHLVGYLEDRKVLDFHCK